MQKVSLELFLQIFHLTILHTGHIRTITFEQGKNFQYINVIQLEKSVSGELLGTLTVYPCMIMVLALPIYFTWLIYSNRQKIFDEDQEFIEKYGTLVDGLSRKDTFSILWRV